MTDYPGKVTAAQYSANNMREVLEKSEKAMEMLFQRGIDFMLEADAGALHIKILVEQDQTTAARDALNSVFPKVVRNLRMHTDSSVVLSLSKNLIKPGQTVIVGKSPQTSKLPGAEPFTIGGDGLMGNTHVAIEWDGFEAIKVKALDGNRVMVGGVEVPADEWMTIEPGTKIDIGVSTLRFMPTGG
jgi:hypothetical protein